MAMPKEVSTNSLLFTGRGAIVNILLTSGTTNSTLKVYDSIDSDGSLIISVKAEASKSFAAYFNNKEFETAAYAVVTGTDAKAYIDLR